MDLFSQIKVSMLQNISRWSGVSTANIPLIKRNKSLKEGDFLVPLSGLDKSLSLQNDSLQWEGGPVPIAHHSIENGHLMVSVDRKEAFEQMLRTICSDSEAVHKFLCRDPKGLVLITCSSLSEKCHANAFDAESLSDSEQHDGELEKESGHVESEVTLNHLRSLLLSDHIQSLLEKNGYEVTQVPYALSQQSKEKLTELDITVQQSTLTNEEEIESRRSVISKLMSLKYAKSGQNVSDESRHLDKDLGKRAPIVTLNLYKFLQDHRLQHGKDGFDKNIQLLHINHAEDHRVNQVAALVEHTCSLNKMPEQCIHISPCEQDFSQQQVDILWKMVASSQPAQYHVVHGPVTVRKSQSILAASTLSQFIQLRKEQMKEAFVIKYGDVVQGSDWDNTIHQLTVAAIKFELLTTSTRNAVKLDLGEDCSDVGGPVDSKGGVFVMYNCARLATLFHHFDQAVQKGIYPDLPPVDSVDFAVLREEEEWELFFNYILPYPSLVQSTVKELESGKLKPNIHTHRICQFLQDLSRDLSSYYSRTHVLGEARAHLMPMMYARLYLLRSLQHIIHHGLSLLNIQPVTQL